MQRRLGENPPDGALEGHFGSKCGDVVNFLSHCGDLGCHFADFMDFSQPRASILDAFGYLFGGLSKAQQKGEKCNGA